MVGFVQSRPNSTTAAAIHIPTKRPRLESTQYRLAIAIQRHHRQTAARVTLTCAWFWVSVLAYDKQGLIKALLAVVSCPQATDQAINLILNCIKLSYHYSLNGAVSVSESIAFGFTVVTVH